MSLQIGQKAPDFKLRDTAKNEITLDSFRGHNLILFFFPMAWTSTCTREMCMLQEDYSIYKGMNAVPVGVSVDTLYALKRYAEDYNLTDIMMLSDFNKEAIRAYDVVHADFNGYYKDVAMRATFVIDGEGILRFAEVLPKLGDFPDMEAIKKTVSCLK
jgi:peroxiredoxin